MEGSNLTVNYYIFLKLLTVGPAMPHIYCIQHSAKQHMHAETLTWLFELMAYEQSLICVRHIVLAYPS